MGSVILVYIGQLKSSWNFSTYIARSMSLQLFIDSQIPDELSLVETSCGCMLNRCPSVPCTLYDRLLTLIFEQYNKSDCTDLVPSYGHITMIIFLVRIIAINWDYCSCGSRHNSQLSRAHILTIHRLSTLLIDYNVLSTYR